MNSLKVWENILSYMNETQEISSDSFHFNAVYNEYVTLKHQIKSIKKEEIVTVNNGSVLEKVSSCYKCHLGKSRTQVTRFGYLEQDPAKQLPYALILDIPSIADKIQGGFYSQNPISNMYQNILSALGLNHRQVYTTSAVKCYSSTELPNDLSLVNICTQYLKEELSQIKPKLIIAMGETTHRLLTNNSSFEDDRGKKLTLFGEHPVVFTHHPKWAVMNPQYKKLIWNDLKEHAKEIKKHVETL